MQDRNELLIEEPQPGERLLATVAANGPQVTNNSHTVTMRLRCHPPAAWDQWFAMT